MLRHGSGPYDVREQEGYDGSLATGERVLQPGELEHLGGSRLFRRNREDVPEDLLGSVPRALRQGLLGLREQPVDKLYQLVIC
jgi:hypothetical protein